MMTMTPLSVRSPPPRRKPRSSTERRPRLGTLFRTMRNLTRTSLVAAGSELMGRDRVGAIGRRRRMLLLTLSRLADIQGRGQARGQHQGPSGTKSTLRLQQVSSLPGSLRPASSAGRLGISRGTARRSEIFYSRHFERIYVCIFMESGIELCKLSSVLITESQFVCSNGLSRGGGLTP